MVNNNLSVFMLVANSQFIIFMCIILFIIFNLVSVLLYQETYSTTDIKIDDIKRSWRIISTVSIYPNWWSKIQNEESVIILYKNNLQNIKIMIQEKEVWTFTIRDDANILHIKSQKLTTSKFKDFVNKCFFKESDLNKFVKDFKRIVKNSN